MSLEPDISSGLLLREHGLRLSKVIATSSFNTPTELARIVQSVARDLMPEMEEIHGAILDACLLIVRVKKASPGVPNEVILANLREAQQRTYNASTVAQVVLFSEGFLGVGSEQIINTQLGAPESFDKSPQSSLISAPASRSVFSPNSEIAIKSNASHGVVFGSFTLAILTLGILGAVTFKVLESGNPIQRLASTNTARTNDSQKKSDLVESGSNKIQESIKPRASQLQQLDDRGANPIVPSDLRNFSEDAVISQVTESSPPGLRIATATLTYNDGDLLSGKFRIYCPSSQIRPVDYKLTSSSGVLKKSGSWWEVSFAPRYKAEKELVQKVCDQ